MKAVLTLFILLICTSLSYAQFSLEMWHEGRVILEEGDTLRGEVKYDLENNAIRVILPNKTEKTFTAHKAWYVEIFDEQVGVYREFFALPYEVRPGFETMVYFEVLQKGNITLMSRERLVQRTVQSAPYNFYRNAYTYTDVAYQYYVLKEGSDIKVLSTKKKDILSIMGKYQTDVKKFMKSNRLDSDRRTDLIRTFAYYNALVAEKAEKARRD